MLTIQREQRGKFSHLDVGMQTYFKSTFIYTASTVYTDLKIPYVMKIMQTFIKIL